MPPTERPGSEATLTIPACSAEPSSSGMALESAGTPKADSLKPLKHSAATGTVDGDVEVGFVHATPSAPRQARKDTILPGVPKLDDHHDTHAEAPKAIILSPKECYDHIVAAGVSKTQIPFAKRLTLGILAGFYIGFSFMLTLTVGGQIPTLQHDHPGLFNFIYGAVGFPLGLTIIVVAGADLFTSSCMYMVTAWCEGRVGFLSLVKAWVFSWFANLVGCLIMAQIVVAAELFKGKETFSLYLAHKKTSYSFGAALCRGILCNWLVNLAVWMASGARDMTGKAVAVYLPVSAFVTLGTEHCIANQFMLSLAYFLGPGDLTVRHIITKNLIPVTIGNTIGGAFFVGMLYAGTYGTLYDRMWLRTVQFYIWAVPKATRERIADAYDACCHRFASLHLPGHDADPAAAPALKDGGVVESQVSVALARQSGAATPKRMLSCLVKSATRPDDLNAFERKKTVLNGGSDAVV